MYFKYTFIYSLVGFRIHVTLSVTFVLHGTLQNRSIIAEGRFTPSLLRFLLLLNILWFKRSSLNEMSILTQFYKVDSSQKGFVILRSKNDYFKHFNCKSSFGEPDPKWRKLKKVFFVHLCSSTHVRLNIHAFSSQWFIVSTYTASHTSCK